MSSSASTRRMPPPPRSRSRLGSRTGAIPHSRSASTTTLASPTTKRPARCSSPRRAWSIESRSSTNWGRVATRPISSGAGAASGPAWWTLAQALWDADAPATAADYRNDFLSHAFGPAAPAMDAYYAVLEDRALWSEHLVGTMYRSLQQAFSLTSDPAIQARLADLAVYTRYLSSTASSGIDAHPRRTAPSSRSSKTSSNSFTPRVTAASSNRATPWPKRPTSFLHARSRPVPPGSRQAFAAPRS